MTAAGYARLGDGHALLCRVGAPFGPLSVAVTGLDAADLRPGIEVAASPGVLVVGAVAISLERMRVRGRAAAPSASPAVDAATVASVAALLPPLPPSLAAGLRALEAGQVGEAVAALAGRGAGLTPEGDDVLAGYSAWRHATGHPVALAETAAGLASPIGLSYLRCAERGELPAVAAVLLAAARAGDRPAALVSLPALLRWGSSSGAALAHGIIAGARARATVGARDG
jgi:hypothetical protein